MKGTIPRHIMVLAIASSALLLTLMIFVLSDVFEPGILRPSMLSQQPVEFLANWIVLTLTVLCCMALVISALRWKPSR